MSREADIDCDTCGLTLHGDAELLLHTCNPGAQHGGNIEVFDSIQC